MARGSEIETLIHSYKIPDFKGIYTIASIPKLEVHQFVIFNLSPTPPGTHWAYLTLRSVDSNNKEHFEMIDSLGVRSCEKIKAHLPRDSFVVYNQTQLQPNESKICGLYCVYYAVLKSENEDLDFDDLVRFAFTQDVNSNDARVSHFFMKQ